MKTNIVNKLKVSLVAALMFVGLATSVNATSLSTVITGSSTNGILTNQVVIRSITMANSGTNVCSVKLFDSPSTSVSFSVAAYTNVLITVGNYTNAYTDILGNSVSTIYTNVMNQSSNYVAAYTQPYPVLTAQVVPAATTVVFTPSSPMYAFGGILSTNNAVTNLTITVDYVPFK